MSDWSHGYNVSHGYTYGFYRELAPDWLDLCARLSGFVAPSRSASGAFRYLELGCGQGAGLCMLAAANPDGDFVGVDFNPEHIAHAHGLAIDAGLTNIRFIEADFADLGAAWPPELGQFDYVVLHGIYSWVPVPVRHALVKCLEHSVPPGGLVYNSYNSKPGWVSTMPFQHLARRMQVAGALTGAQAIDQAIDLFENLQSNNSTMFQALPTLKNRVETVKTQNRSYLIQEYLHDYWYPFWFSEVAEEFASAKLSYVGTATIVELMLPGILSKESRALIEKQADPVLQQEVQDCAINQSFRRDIFCRGPRRGFAAGFKSVMPTMLHLLTTPKEDPLKVPTTVGELSVKAEVYGPVIAQLTEGPKTIGQLIAHPDVAKHGLQGAVHSLMLLIHAGAVAVGRSSVAAPEVAQQFNAAVSAAVSGGAPYKFFAVPAFGSALPMTDIDCMLVDSWLKTADPNEQTLTQGVTDRLARLNRSISQDGKALTGDELKQRLGEISRTFVTETLPRWQHLGAMG